MTLIPDARLHGWWSDEPVVALAYGGGACSSSATTAVDPEGAASALLASAHVAPGRIAVLVLASWCSEDTEVELVMDWARLGLAAADSVVATPAIPGLQAAAAAVRGDAPVKVLLRRGEGVVLVVQPATANPW